MTKHLLPLQDRAERRSVVEEIWEELQRLILHGTIAPGTRLLELDIASRTGASQASVREALQHLERDGLVDRKGRMGTFVTDVDPQQMQDILRVRLTVETAALRRAVRRVGATEIHELMESVERMRAAGKEGDVVAVVEHDMAFHRHICEWADHPILLRTWLLLHAQVVRFTITHDRRHFPDLSTIADLHLPLVEAIADGDPDQAVERMTAHIENAIQGAARIAASYTPPPARASS